MISEVVEITRLPGKLQRIIRRYEKERTKIAAIKNFFSKKSLLPKYSFIIIVTHAHIVYLATANKTKNISFIPVKYKTTIAIIIIIKVSELSHID